MVNIVILIFAVIAAAFFVAWMLAKNVKKQDAGTPKMQEICNAIHEGAMAFLHREYKIIGIFIVIFAILMVIFLDHPSTPEFNEGIFIAVSFVIGALASLLAGYIGMRIATIANVRTTSAARKDLRSAFTVAFRSGCVMGLCLVSFAVLGIMVLYVIYNLFGLPKEVLMEVITGFALGGSSIALFCRVGGGIYTKAADVGADLVGKVEKGIPEDDPRNPAV
ncbi:sodium/proton-translocating pyrophosphatase, partial [Candidatus Woesearchaeota archaeon]|nr:sodium/proton-translocating pyrophosphatase [Candidatus Woesearchaeota archaeon]